MNRRIAFFMVLVFFTGCSKDKIDSLITGKWEAVNFTTSVPVDENGDGIENTDLTKEMSCVSMHANFSSNGKFTLESTNVTYDITYVDGKVVLKPSGCGVQTEKGTWNMNETSTMLFLEFIIDGKDEPEPVDINIELSENRLVLKDLFYEETEETITYTIEFERE